MSEGGDEYAGSDSKDRRNGSSKIDCVGSIEKVKGGCEMRFDVMKKGDEVLNVTEDRIVIRRKNGEVDVLFYEVNGKTVRIDQERSITIGYGNGEVVQEEDGVTIITF